MTIKDATDAIEYWLENVVLRGEVNIKSIIFDEKNHFTIILQRTK